MRNLSVIIPSKNATNFNECAKAVRRHEPGIHIICVDDGINTGRMPQLSAEIASKKNGGGITEFVPGEKPFIFSRNVNIGIRWADDNDVIILNDDALLQSPGGFTLLQQAAEEHPEYGVIASTTNAVGNRNQFRQDIGLREDRWPTPNRTFPMVCFVAVLIPRRTIETVGLLDERYEKYGMDDDDYCLRVHNAGLKIGIHDGCFVDHNCLPSTYRGAAGQGGDYSHNLEIFKQKWGMDNGGVRV